MIIFAEKVEKPWGYEIILTPKDCPFTGKILHLNEGCRFSYQYHEQKEESLTLLNGEALIIWEKDGQKMEEKMEKLKGYLIKPFEKHRVKALTACDIMEASTPEKGLTVRLEDDYNRPNENKSV